MEFLLNQELEEFEAQVHESLVRPVLAELRTLAESIRRSEIERACNGKTLDAEVLDQVTRRIVNRFLHGPSIALRRSDPALDHLHAHCLRLMFGLRQSMPQDTPPETSGAHGVSE